MQHSAHSDETVLVTRTPIYELEQEQALEPSQHSTPTLKACATTHVVLTTNLLSWNSCASTSCNCTYAPQPAQKRWNLKSPAAPTASGFMSSATKQCATTAPAAGQPLQHNKTKHQHTPNDTSRAFNCMSCILYRVPCLCRCVKEAALHITPVNRSLTIAPPNDLS